MKFIHIADVHLGAEPDAGPLYSQGRREEIWNTFEHVITVCENEKTDLLLIAGDLFHRQPLVRELKEVNYLFSGLSHTKVVLIAGNHDYIRLDSNYRNFDWSENVYPLFADHPEYVDFPEFQTAVYGFSYNSREIKEPLYDRLQAQGKEPVEILLAHGGDASHIPVDFHKLEQSGFAYVAMGHIHLPHAVIKDHIIYAGALEPTDSNDTGAHGYVKGQITADKISTVFVPCASREYIHLNVDVSSEDTMGSVRTKIKDLISDYGNENIYKIRLKGKRDPDIDFDVKWLAQTGNILEVIDETGPEYDFEELYQENKDNLLGRYIGCFRGCEEGSIEYEALCEGVEALLGRKTRGIS